MADEHAPWALRGEVIVVLVRPRQSSPAAIVGDLAGGLRALPGPLVVLAERFTDSPVGPYIALSFGRAARIGLRPGISFTTAVVSHHARRTAGRLNWGFPGEVGALSWDVDEQGGAIVRWPERGLVVRARRRGRLAVPVILPVRSLQRRADGPVVVPGRVRGQLHLARAQVIVRVDDALAPLAGTHPAAWITAARLLLRPARHPLGLLSSLQAPLRAPEPAMTSARSPRDERPLATWSA